MTVSQILQEARLKIADGWCQGFENRKVDNNGHREYCLIGSVKSAVGRERDATVLYRRVFQLLADHIPEIKRGGSGRTAKQLIYYNDYPFRTQAEVLALIDAALTEVTK